MMAHIEATQQGQGYSGIAAKHTHTHTHTKRTKKQTNKQTNKQTKTDALGYRAEKPTAGRGSCAHKQAELLAKRVDIQGGTPDTWSDDPASGTKLVEVDPLEQQYWDVSDRLRETMDDAWISQLWRVQNRPLWNFYSFHKSKLEGQGVQANERRVWHGTSQLDPLVICNDEQVYALSMW